MNSKCCSPVFWLWCTTELIFGDSLTGTQDCAQLGLRLPGALCYLVLGVILKYCSLKSIHVLDVKANMYKQA